MLRIRANKALMVLASLVTAGVALSSLLTFSPASAKQPAPVERSENDEESPSRDRGPTRTIAVVPFSSRVPPSQLGGADVGREVARLLALRLQEQGTYALVPEEAVERALTKLGGRFRLTSRNAALFGKDLGVEAIVIGTVQEFQLDETTTQARNHPAKTIARTAGGYTPYAGSVVRALASSAPTPKSQVRVAFQSKLIDVATGLPIATTSGVGQSKKRTALLWKPKKEIDFTSEDFNESAAGEATNIALESIRDQLVESAGKVDAVAMSNIHGTVVEVENGVIRIDVGAALGLKVGDVLDAQRPLRITRKATNSTQPTRRVSAAPNMMLVGTLKLFDVKPDRSFGRTVGTRDDIKVGDTVRVTASSIHLP